ncbi:unnamed protein product [Allacma fusca]|uniref:BTB domain-containing protein n=1 Tax=Allacma fusca TaxID=39272 RepID=A0A8J2LQ91_9HEXA|nr:unnamed protein product [Allacma fusca]
MGFVKINKFNMASSRSAEKFPTESVEATTAGGGHIKQVFSDRRLAELRKRNALMDVTLVAGPLDKRVSIRANRAVLSLASQYFWELFVDEHEMKKCEHKVFGIDPDCLEVLLNYIYTGNFQLTEENVENMHQAANQLKIEGFLEKIQEYLTVNIDDSNWDRRLKFARIQHMDDLTDVVISHISSDYIRYLQTPQFLELPAEEVFTVLSAPVRLENPEEAIFSAILKWLKYKQSERIRSAAALLEEIDLSSLPEDFLQFHFDKEEVLRTIECLEILRKIFKKPFQPESRVDEDVFIFPEPATNVVHPKPKQLKTEIIDSPSKLSKPHEVSLSGRGKVRRRKSKNVPDDTVEQEDAPPEKKSKAENAEPATEPVKPVRALARKKTGGLRSHYEAIKTQNEIANKNCDVEAGSRTSKSSDPSTTKITPSDSTNSKADSTEVLANNTVFKVIYLRECEKEGARVMMTDLCQKYPQQLRPFLKCNKSTSLLWVSQIRRMYALGGVTTVLNENGSSNLVKYSSEAVLLKNSDKEKHWLKGPDMIQERTNFTPVIIGDYIYAVGGAEGICGNEAVNCAERLHIKSKKPRWEAIDYLNRARHNYGAGVIDDKIYACGGYGAEDAKETSSMGILSTVECYDPKEDKWTLVSSMMFERHGLSVAVLDSKLYAIGGGGINSHTNFNKDLDTMKSVEMYDPKENCWNKVASMNRPRKNGSAVVLNGKIYAIGGDVSRGDGLFKSSVEVYSPSLDKWQIITEELDKDGIFNSVACQKGVEMLLKRLFVGNLPETVTSSEVSSKFSSFGHIDGVDVRTKNGATFAFINLNFEDEINLRQCIDLLNNTTWKGNLIKVQPAKESFLDRLKREQEESKRSDGVRKLLPPLPGQSDSDRGRINTEIKPEITTIRQKPKKTVPAPQEDSDSDDEAPHPFPPFRAIAGAEPPKEEAYNKINLNSCDSLQEKLLTIAGVKQKATPVVNAKPGVPSNLLRGDSNEVLKPSWVMKPSPLNFRKKNSDEVRQKSLESRLSERMNQKGIVKMSLANVLPPVSEPFQNKHGSNQKSLSSALFQDDEGSDPEEDASAAFKIRPQFEGETGAKNLELSSKFASYDQRFTLDERFQEEEPEPEKELEEEKKSSFAILSDILGTTVAPKLRPKGYHSVIVQRYDPENDTGDQTVSRKKKSKPEMAHGGKEEVIAGSDTKVQSGEIKTQEKATYQVASNLKELFTSDSQSTGFRLLKSFPSGNTGNEADEDEIVEPSAKKSKNENSFWQSKNPFKYDSSDSEDEGEPLKTTDDVSFIQMYKDSFFFKKNDNRFAGLDNFFLHNEEKMEDVLYRFNNGERNELKLICKGKIKNTKRKSEKRMATLQRLKRRMKAKRGQKYEPEGSNAVPLGAKNKK